jgi:hypothetical protein
LSNNVAFAVTKWTNKYKTEDMVIVISTFACNGIYAFS